ncbi:MAG: DUF86 domain-containing protein [Leptospiraceae bacterium]|nr:DUF86 domain-containing protein [Leptospiraceae bacterium]MCZ8347150.1 DUF86 domain-containing protein [Leptospiraceae bacterium]
MSEEILERLLFILESIEIIQKRFGVIKNPDEFIASDEGFTILDSIAMRLQSIGESVKSIYKLDNQFLISYTEIEWEKVIKMRDMLSHHYDGFDHEIIYQICVVYIPELKHTIQKMLRSINKREIEDES